MTQVEIYFGYSNNNPNARDNDIITISIDDAKNSITNFISMLTSGGWVKIPEGESGYRLIDAKKITWIRVKKEV